MVYLSTQQQRPRIYCKGGIALTVPSSRYPVDIRNIQQKLRIVKCNFKKTDFIYLSQRVSFNKKLNIILFVDKYANHSSSDIACSCKIYVENCLSH